MMMREGDSQLYDILMNGDDILNFNASEIKTWLINVTCIKLLFVSFVDIHVDMQKKIWPYYKLEFMLPYVTIQDAQIQRFFKMIQHT